MITELYGDLIKAALNHEVDVIAHCCNCFCKQKLGIASEMVRTFATDRFPLEDREHEGDYNKLGQIEFKLRVIKDGSVWVVNAYGQHHWSHPSSYGIPLDYDALRLCFRKINNEFKERKIGVPGLIGSGLAKGRPETIKQIIASEFKDSNLFIYYPK